MTPSPLDRPPADLGQRAQAVSEDIAHLFGCSYAQGMRDGMEYATQALDGAMESLNGDLWLTQAAFAAQATEMLDVIRGQIRLAIHQLDDPEHPGKVRKREAKRKRQQIRDILDHRKKDDGEPSPE